MKVSECWICGNQADSGEHIVKRSDLKVLFPTVTQSTPIYFHTKNRINRKIPSIDSKVLKAKNSLCANCNNSRTQNYDKSWEALSRWLLINVETLALGVPFYGAPSFPLKTDRAMRDLHLFFVKLFGTHIQRDRIPIPLFGFSQAIRTGKPHSNIFIKFGRNAESNIPIVAGTDDLHTKYDNSGIVAATWIYFLNRVVVQVTILMNGQRPKGKTEYWHPKFGSNSLVWHEFIPDHLLTK